MGEPAADPLERDYVAELLELTAPGGAEAFGRLVAAYASDGRGRLDQLRGAIARGDEAALRAAAHALKGASACVGAARLAELCRRVEAAADFAPRDLAGLAADVAKEFDLVCEALGTEVGRAVGGGAGLKPEA